uniref:Carrier domain-containing protein n=2 Tax=Oryzias sinensis TaxID=183150 RepID=A0A8C7YV41_9TELE
MEDGIAVVGMGCNFPGGEGLENFWKVLLEGQNCVVDIPSERFETSFWSDADATKPGKTPTTRAALIEGFNEFDHKFFGISEAEADVMDPQQKLLLQCSYRALEDAGTSIESISGSRTGVYVGLMNRDYEMLRNNNPNTISHYNATGTATSVAANRISFTFNLTGPSFAIDSACSSSLVALHVACQAIRLGDCEMALCGGVNCIIEPRVFVALSKAKMTSPEGTSKPFSIRADGYGRGEGCGVLLLKPLGSAKRDRNKIWGIISKTAINQDGRSVTPITKPSKVQQEELLRGIYSDIADIQYIEAHGTGTPAGDTTEAGSISDAIAAARAPGSKTLMVGSVKGNIGHTESAAGVAGVIKVLLMMKHETIVPSVFYSDDSAGVDMKALKLHVPIKAEKWETAGPHGRVAGVNSFGFGGTNAHVVLREYKNEGASAASWLKVCVLSAASERSLILTINDTHRRLSQSVDLQGLSYTSACGRSHFRHKYRKAFAASSLPDLQNQLKSALNTKVEPVRSSTRVVFVFCGNGVSYRGMCSQLMKDVPAFREKVKEVERTFNRHETICISKWLCGEDCDFSQPGVVQPLLFAVQVGLASLLKSWGIKPDTVLGHSIGEVAAAHCSGLLSLEDAVKVVYHRGSLQSKVTGGKMLVVGNVEVEQVLEVLAVFSGKVCVAAFNSPRSCTLSGEADAVDGLYERLKLTFTDENLFLCLLDVPAAYHSHMMEPVLDDIERRIGPLHANSMECKLFSTTTGQMCSDGDFVSGTYWKKNIRGPVYFEEALHAAVRDGMSGGNLVFVEVGPRRSLQRYICDTLRSDTTVLPVVQPGKDLKTISYAVARLFELGVNVDWHQLNRGCEMLPINFPVYQFDTTKNNVNFEALRNDNGLAAISHHPFASQINQNNNELIFNLSLDITPYLWEHKNNGFPIVPGSFYVELALASVRKSKSPVSLFRLSLTFQSVLTLTSKFQQLKVTLQQSGTETLFKIQSSAATHASGTCSYAEDQPLLEEPTICPDVIYQRCKLVMTRREVYSVLSEAGFEYGPPFQHLSDVRYGNELKEAVTTLQVPGEVLRHLHECFLHPVVLDYFMQMTAVVALEQLTAKQGFPSGIASIVISRPLQEKMVIYCRVTHAAPEFLDVCGCFSTTDGNVLVELMGVRISFLDSSVSQSLLFHNESVAVGLQTDLENSKIKAIVFEDKLSIAKGLKPYLSPESVLVESKEKLTADQVRDLVLNSLASNEALTDVLFLWGVEDLTHLSAEMMLNSLVTCCEFFRQIVLAVKESKRSCTLRVITHRSTEMTVDHVSPGFVLSGLTRACAAEVVDLSLQLIDLAFVTSEDIQVLARVIRTCKHQEVRISNGQIWGTSITQTQVKIEDLCQSDSPFEHHIDFVLQTNDPYRVANLSAVPEDKRAHPFPETSVEVQLTRVCVHSSDYFPATTSHLDFGETVYWSKHGSQRHKLLALDFSGIVTAVGKDVHRYRVGDHVASCYAVEATTAVVIPEVACYSTTTLPFLRETPCVSYFILAWEILQNRLSEVKNHPRQLAVVSSNSASALVKVLALTASRSGWNVSSWSHVGQKLQRCGAVVFLPPFDPSWREACDDHVRHVVFVCSSHMSPKMSARMFALKKEEILVHKLDVANVLQRSNLREQNGKISNWLSSLGFDEASLPLRGELHGVEKSESYFTTTKVQQVVLNYEGTTCSLSDIPIFKRPENLFKKRGVYIVTGGISGLGLETVKFIGCNGGGCIATLSRRILSEEMQFEMNLLQKRYGVSIIHIQCDVSSLVQVVNAISEIILKFPSCPIKGVFHSAAVLHDALIPSLNEGHFRKVLQPKVCGVLNLHHATLHNKLDFFVCYSSISSFIGNASQCNYAAANSFLDAFCHYRRNCGLAGQSINWGPLNVGLLLNKEHFQRFLEAKGMTIMGLQEIHETLRMSLIMNRPQQVICKFNYRNLHHHVLSQNASLRERLSALVAARLKDGSEPKVQPLSSTRQRLRTIISEMLNMREEELEDEASLCALGVDSMLAMTLQNKIFQETGVNVPLVLILDPSNTLTSLEEFVLSSN